MDLRNMFELLADTNNVNVDILSTNINNADKKRKLHLIPVRKLIVKNSREKLIVLWHIWRRREMHIEFGWRT
jgi:hypothetical protein